MSEHTSVERQQDRAGSRSNREESNEYAAFSSSSGNESEGGALASMPCSEDFQTLVSEVGDSAARYCRKRPVVAAFSVFAFGFYIGWKVKPW